MKKTVLYILAISMLCVVLLSGCGETGDRRNDVVTQPNATDMLPDMDEIVPDEMMPNEEDGIVNDTDGILNENDNENNQDNLVDGQEANRQREEETNRMGITDTTSMR